MASPVVLSRSRAVPVSPDAAFAGTLPIPLPQLFHRWYGPIPPIKAIRNQTADWSEAGESRTIVLTGGGSMQENLTDVDPPRSFSYTITKITGPLALLIDHVEGAWIFEPAGTGTKVTWRWTVHPKSELTALALPVFGQLWRGYANRALETLSDHLVG